MYTAMCAARGRHLRHLVSTSQILVEDGMLTSDPRELCYIIYNDFARVYMIVDEGNTLFWTVAPQDRDTSKAESSRTKNFLGSI
jgi:hypothetical protein